MPGLGDQADALAALGRTAPVDAGEEGLLAAVAVGVELLHAGRGAVDVGVGAELLDDIDREAQAVAGAHVHVLGTHAERRVLAGLGQHVTLDRHDIVAELDPAVDHGHVEQVHRGRADEAGDEDVVGVVVHVARGVALLQVAVLEDRDPVAHRHGLGLVVGDVDRGDAEAALQRSDLGAGLHAQLGVEVGQRLVHEEDLRRADDRAAHGDALTLTTGEGLGLALEVGLEVEDLGGLEDALVDLVLGDAGDLEGEAHVVGDRHVRIERVVLEDHGDVAVLGGQVGDVAVTDEDLAAVDLFEAGEHPQRGGLATSRGADEDEELAVGDVDVELVDGRLRVARVVPGRVLEAHGSHIEVSPSPAGTCRTIRCKG